MMDDITRPAADVFEAARSELGIGREYIVICGMALGYADPNEIVNTFQPPRIEVDDYAVFLD
jgi:hypothetical protein